MTLLALLRRGLLAGCFAGLLTGAFAFLITEPVMDRAVRLEAARDATDHTGQAGASAADHAAEHAEVFTRSTQHVGLLVAALATGLALGVLFSVVYALLHRNDPGQDSWRRSLLLAGSGFLGVALLPFVRYPANPPGVGDSGTVSLRAAAWIGAILLGVVSVVVAWRLHGWLVSRAVAEPVRQLAVAAVPVLGLVATFLILPDNPDPLPVPADLLWTFRVLSLASMTVMWAGLGAAFGLLGYRAERAVDVRPAAPVHAVPV
jgi:predicted cobalt transporter CbtA